MVNRGDGASRARDARSARRPTAPASPRTVLEACREAGRGSATKQVAREDSEREVHHDSLTRKGACMPTAAAAHKKGSVAHRRIFVSLSLSTRRDGDVSARIEAQHVRWWACNKGRGGFKFLSR